VPQPAVHKLKLLDEVRAQVAKRPLEELLLDNGLLGAFAKWLEPLPKVS